jgi:hypothetical protein
VLLVWIGVKLLLPEDEDGHGNIEGSDKLWGAVKTVIVADFVMSVDNVIAIAGAAESSGGGHSMALVIFGVLVSIPIIVWGSQLVIKLMDRFPFIITAGGMLLGWIAGTMIVTDPALVNPDVMPKLPKIPATDGCAMPRAWPAHCWCWCWASGWRAASNRPRRPTTHRRLPRPPAICAVSWWPWMVQKPRPAPCSNCWPCAASSVTPRRWKSIC